MDRLKFPHLEHLSRATEVLKAEHVIVTEKIDGFNARFGRGLDGEFWIGTRNVKVNPETEPCQGFTAFALAREDRVPPGLTIFGEWAGKGIQKRLDYGEPDFYFFDGHHGMNREAPDGGSWFDPDDLAEWSATLDLKMPHRFHEGPPPTLVQIEEWRATPGIEGIVIRAYPMVVDKYGHPLIAKYKAIAFSETSSEKASRPPLDMTGAQGFVDEYVNGERLSHVIELVRETGLDPLDPRSTGDVLRQMYQDITREGAADFAALDEEQQKFVGKLQARETAHLLASRRDEVLAA